MFLHQKIGMQVCRGLGANSKNILINSLQFQLNFRGDAFLEGRLFVQRN